MSDTHAISVTLKASSDFDAPWIVVYGNSPNEVADRLTDIQGTGLLAEVVTTAALLRDAERGSNPSAGATPAPRRAKPAADPGRPDGPAPTCQHGEKEWVNPDNKPWKGWFCPLKDEKGNRIRGTGDCKAQFIN